MFEAFLNNDDDELDIEDYQDLWSQHRFSIVKEILDRLTGDNLSFRNRMRYYRLCESIFKGLQVRLASENETNE